MQTLYLGKYFFNQIPSSIDDISLERFIRFRNLDLADREELARWILDCTLPFEKHLNIRKDVDSIIELAVPAINEIWAFMGSEDKNFIPNIFDVFGHEVKLTSSFLNTIPDWSHLFSKRIMFTEVAKPHFDPTDRLPEVLAHYLYSALTKSPYDEVKAKSLSLAIELLPMKPCVQLGSFLLQKVIALHSTTLN